MAELQVVAVKEPLSLYANAVVGAAAGCVEVIINQPFVAIKNALQEKRPVSLNPLFLYRGVVINSSSLAPITAVQFAVNGVMSSYFSNNGARQLTDGERLLSAAVGGAMSALVSGPAEIVMIQQQRTGTSLAYAASTIMFKHGFTTLYKGLMPTMFREALFTCGYLGLGPVLRDQLLRSSPDIFKGREMGANILGSVMAGLVAAVLTQPADTIKTRLQGDIGGLGLVGAEAQPVTYTKPLRATQLLWAEGGLRTFYAGLVPRGLRITTAVFILTNTGEQIEKLIRRYS